MAQRRHHYEQAFEAFLRANRIPYVAVDEARKALLPEVGDASAGVDALKSFDFVLYREAGNLLVDVKGRKIAGAGSSRWRGGMENWVTMEDVDSLERWESLFGDGFRAAFIFMYWCEVQPPDGLFQEIFEHRERWYALRVVRLHDYMAHMKVRSPKWGTLHVPRADFRRISETFSPHRMRAGSGVAGSPCR